VLGALLSSNVSLAVAQQDRFRQRHPARTFTPFRKRSLVELLIVMPAARVISLLLVRTDKCTEPRELSPARSVTHSPYVFVEFHHEPPSASAGIIAVVQKHTTIIHANYFAGFELAHNPSNHACMVSACSCEVITTQ
jgi:hypothetical protein